ncbi:hypothetical protein ACOME3_010821 [Neoechinorhynchus agilis]
MSTKLATMAQRFTQLSKSNLANFWKYASVELKPPMPSEFPQLKQEFRQCVEFWQRSYKSKSGAPLTNLTIKEVALNSLVATEVLLWFFIGEVIGRGSIIGYDISRTTICKPYNLIPFI